MIKCNEVHNTIGSKCRNTHFVCCEYRKLTTKGLQIKMLMISETKTVCQH